MAKYYESDLTKMMRDLLKDNPNILEEQKKGRAIWWDHKQDQETLKRAKESLVKQQPYVYQTKS